MVPTDADSVPKLDDILARLAALAPVDIETDASGRIAAPVPESASTLREPILDLTRIAEATERLAPAAVTLDLDAAGVDTAPPPPVYSFGRDTPAPTEDPIIDLTDGPDPVVVEAGPEVAVTDVAGHEIAEPAVDDPDPSTAKPATKSFPRRAPKPRAVAPVGDLIDIRRPDADVSTPDVAVRKSPGTRTRNPFRRLILWSVALGIILLVVAGVVIVT